eukprot:gene24348-29584_t
MFQMTEMGQAMMGLLPTPQFCSGFTYSVTAEWRRIGVKPFALHTTYVQGQDLEAKLLRRYWQEGRYLVYNATVPEELLALENLRNAIALARVLGRILEALLDAGRAGGSDTKDGGVGARMKMQVMPEFWCTCEGGLGAPSRNCVDTYHVLHLPYRCPADHLLSAKTWMRSSFPVTFREASFLENPLLAPEIRCPLTKCNAPGFVDFAAAVQLNTDLT